MELGRRLVDVEPSNRTHQDNLASAYNALGATRLSAGRLAESADSFRAAVAIRERLVRDEPNNAAFQRNLLVSYGSLGDVLGYRLGENLGDLHGAEAAYARAVELANVAHEKDPADRRALFDLASVKLRLGSLFVDDRNAVAALPQLEESAGLIGGLLAREPGSDRYGYVAIVIDRRLGDALATLPPRRGEAIEHLMNARNRAALLLNGPNGPSARQQRIMATAKLARLFAEARDPRAGAFAERAAEEMAQHPIATPGVAAVVRADLERAAVARPDQLRRPR
jgi:tetratricopeptide (TPR) repeat protein